MILPVFKLGTLALKTLCKPIGNRIKKEAGLHPRFRQYIINIAQANHQFTTNLQRRIYGHATDVAIRPLNEEKAVQAAADLLGELFVFSIRRSFSMTHLMSRLISLVACTDGCLLVITLRESTQVAGAAVVFEVQRSYKSEARKEEQRKQELELMKQRDDELAREVEQLKQRMAELEQLAKERGLSDRLEEAKTAYWEDHEKEFDRIITTLGERELTEVYIFNSL